MSLMVKSKTLVLIKAHQSAKPDGFNPIFFEMHWDIVGPSFINCIKEVFIQEKFPRIGT